jgi:hypothetical protein
VARQHWLDFDLWDTVNVFTQAGVRLDSSIGFNAPGWGFRTRTAWPHLLPAARSDNVSSIVHVAPCLQDGALGDDWKGQIDRLLQLAVQRRATLAFIWHNTAMVRGSRGWASYDYLITRARELGAHFVVGQDIMEAIPAAPVRS